MRLGSIVATAFLLFGCGPKSDAHLPGSAVPSNGGRVSSYGGAVSGNGGSVASAGGANPFSGGGGSGGSSPFNNGGASSLGSGGKSGSGGFASVSGGSPGSGGVAGALGGLGGASSGGTSGGTSPSYVFGSGAEPCSPPTDVSGGKTNSFDSTTSVCYRTADDIDGWGCSNFDGWTLKVNGTAVATCGGTLPPKIGSFYYFQATASATAASYASIFWWGTYHAGPYPAWSGGTTTTSDGGSTPAPDASAAAAPDMAAKSSPDAGALDL